MDGREIIAPRYEALKVFNGYVKYKDKSGKWVSTGIKVSSLAQTTTSTTTTQTTKQETVTPTPQPQPQPPVTQPVPQPMPQNSILGKWGAHIGGQSMEFIFNPDGSGVVINNGQQVNFFYGIQGNILILCDDRNCSTGANQFMFSLNGNTLYVNINGQNIPYQRVAGGGMPAPQAPVNAPAPQQQGLSGTFACQIHNNPQMQLYHEFAGNVYRVYMSQGNMPKTLIEVGSYTLNGTQFNYMVQQSPNQQIVGTSGTNMIQFTGNGYIMQIQGGSITCTRSY